MLLDGPPALSVARRTLRRAAADDSRRPLWRGIAGAWWQEAWGGAYTSSAARLRDPAYLSGERPIELNSGAAEDGHSRVLEA